MLNLSILVKKEKLRHPPIMMVPKRFVPGLPPYGGSRRQRPEGVGWDQGSE